MNIPLGNVGVALTILLSCVNLQHIRVNFAVCVGGKCQMLSVGICGLTEDSDTPGFTFIGLVQDDGFHIFNTELQDNSDSSGQGGRTEEDAGAESNDCLKVLTLTVLRYSKLDIWCAHDLSVFTEYSTVDMRSAGPPPQKGPLHIRSGDSHRFQRRPLGDPGSQG